MITTYDSDYTKKKRMESKRKYKETHKAQINAYAKSYYQAHREEIRAKAKARHAAKKACLK